MNNNQPLNLMSIDNKNIEECIYNIRGQQVMIDSDVAFFFGTEIKKLNQQMKRNKDRFPEDFCFQLNSNEFKSLRSQNVTIDNKNIEECIYNIRGQQVMIDSDVAFFFGVETKNLNKQMKRNIDRFPEDFCFQLNSEEFKNLRFQNVTSNYGGRRYLPYVYTEEGVIALSGVIKSETATKMSVEIARKFIQMRKLG